MKYAQTDNKNDYKNFTIYSYTKNFWISEKKNIKKNKSNQVNKTNIIYFLNNFHWKIAISSPPTLINCESSRNN